MTETEHVAFHVAVKNDKNSLQTDCKDLKEECYWTHAMAWHVKATFGRFHYDQISLPSRGLRLAGI